MYMATTLVPLSVSAAAAAAAAAHNNQLLPLPRECSTPATTSANHMEEARRDTHTLATATLICAAISNSTTATSPVFLAIASSCFLGATIYLEPLRLKNRPVLSALPMIAFSLYLWSLTSTTTIAACPTTAIWTLSLSIAASP